MSNERDLWVQLPVAPKYEVSSEGGIRNALTKAEVFKYEHFGYEKVNLWVGTTKDTRKKKAFTVHFCVANAFLCHTKNSGFVVRHLDGSKKNNRTSNLSVGTHKENENDKKRHGREGSGERNSQCVISESDAMRAIELCSAGATKASVARGLGVHRTTISLLVAGKKWKHLQGEVVHGKHQ
tara:strand:+ start:215 stop:757 length:543 start_codon:yes stop_codon:yes gene_type:complete